MYKVIRDLPLYAAGMTVSDLVFSDFYIKSLIELGYIQEDSGLPKTWEELGEIKGWYIDELSGISATECRTASRNRNVFPTQEEAEACLALSQLCQLRDRYNGQPLSEWCDWSDEEQEKFVIYLDRGKIEIWVAYCTHETLTFKTKELRDEFLNNFKDLILIAKPLL